MTGADDRAILALDTATTRIVVATGSRDGTVDGIATWPAGHRHGETLLSSIERLLDERGIQRSDLGAIVVGTGPGAFTGLRVGIATGKGLAHGLGVPLIGVSTGEALLAATGMDRAVLLLPAGPSDRLIMRAGDRPEPLPAGSEPAIAGDETLVAVDLDGRAPEDATRRGDAARERLGHELLRLGAERLREGVPSELEALVPEYVTLPRGVRSSAGTLAWSPDLR